MTRWASRVLCAALLLSWSCTSADLAVEECDPGVRSLAQDVCNRLNSAATNCELYQCDAASRRCVKRALDYDRDGDPRVVCGGGDCSDEDPTIQSGAAEPCDGKDNDCDGEVDESCTCLPSETGMCSAAADGTPISWPAGSPMGECRHGARTCGGNAQWGPCLDAIAPEPEICDGKDNSCDGRTDEGCNCMVGASMACSETAAGSPISWPGGTPRPECRYGRKTCGSNGQYGPCLDAIAPATEVCDGKDNDCDGTRDEGCACTPGTSTTCSATSTGSPISWPGGTPRPPCQYGQQTCGASGQWGPCNGAVAPQAESSFGVGCDGVDNDCDGATDEDPVCLADLTLPELVLYPLNRTQGDLEFGSNGPAVTVTVSFVGVATTTLTANGTVVMTETSGGTGASIGRLSKPATGSAGGRTIRAIISPSYSGSYTDNDTATPAGYDVIPGSGAVLQVQCVGDTPDDDICGNRTLESGDCSGCRIQFRNVRVRLAP